MSRYASAGGGPVAASKELKQMVKELHKAGIEVSKLNIYQQILLIIVNFMHRQDKIHIMASPFCAGYSGCCLQPYK